MSEPSAEELFDMTTQEAWEAGREEGHADYLPLVLACVEFCNAWSGDDIVTEIAAALDGLEIPHNGADTGIVYDAYDAVDGVTWKRDPKPPIVVHNDLNPCGDCSWPADCDMGCVKPEHDRSCMVYKSFGEYGPCTCGPLPHDAGFAAGPKSLPVDFPNASHDFRHGYRYALALLREAARAEPAPDLPSRDRCRECHHASCDHRVEVGFCTRDDCDCNQFKVSPSGE